MNQTDAHSELRPLTLASVFLAIFLGVLVLLSEDNARAQEPVCSRSDILLCEGFEKPLNPDGSYPGWGWNASWTPTADGTVLCGSALAATSFDGVPGTTPFSGNCSLYWHAGLNREDGIYPDHAIPDQPTTGPVYARFYIKYSSRFTWNPGGAKVFYIRSLTSEGNESWAEQLGSMPACGRWCTDVTGPGVFYIDVQTHEFFLPYNVGSCVTNPQCPEGLVHQGQWYAVEMLCIPNSQAGIADGTARLWINGVLVSDYSPANGNGVDFRAGAPQPTKQLNNIWISAFIGGPTAPHPAESIWYDNIVVATNPIGPFSGSRPAAPTGLTLR